MAILRLDNLLQIFGIVLVIVVSISVVSFTTKLIFGIGQMTAAPRPIYDPDERANMSFVCPFAMSSHQFQYNRTSCFNRTMLHWYIPWMRYDVWRDFRVNNDRKRLKRLRAVRLAEEARKKVASAEVKSENNTEEIPLIVDTPANQKSKDEPSKVVCTLLAALLVVSSILAVCEVFKDKCLAKAKSTAGNSGQRYSFADASLKEQSADVQRQEPFQPAAKVTQTLVHQSSLDRAFSRLSSEVKTPFLRRSSVPAQMMSNIGSSSDLTHGYLNRCSSESPEMRRKSRHFIRRH